MTICRAALDTSCNACLAVQLDGDVAVNATLSTRDRDTDALLVPWIVETLSSADLALPDIEEWIVGVGPGSYSGIRTGIAVVRGVCRGTGARRFGCASSLALARQALPRCAEGDRIAVVHDARRQQVIVSRYQVRDSQAVPLDEPEAIPFDQAIQEAPAWAAAVTPHGDRIADFATRLETATRLLGADHVDAREFLRAGLVPPASAPETEASLEPLYVRPAVFVPPAPIRKV